MLGRRVLLATAYFDLCATYNLYPYLPHCAMALWERSQDRQASGTNRAVDAACFLVAQKTIDTLVLTISDVSDIFSVNEEEVLRLEQETFGISMTMSTELRPDCALIDRLRSLDASLQEHMKTFFNIALIGARLQACCHPSPPSLLPPALLSLPSGRTCRRSVYDPQRALRLLPPPPLTPSSLSSQSHPRRT